MITAQTICALALSLWTADAASWYESRIPAMQETCEEIAGEAERRGHDPTLLVSLAWEESRFKRDARSSAGAVGPLQVLPVHWCPDGEAEGCDLVLAGLEAFESFSERWPEIPETLCHYNGGITCSSRSRDYASRIMQRREDLSSRLYGSDGC